MLREPLADLESSPSVGLVVELESDPRLERLEALGKLAGDVHGAIEQLAVDDLRKVEVDVDPNVTGGLMGAVRPSAGRSGVARGRRAARDWGRRATRRGL
jgi:hypothetical protein